MKRHAVVVGASAGVGLAVAEAFADGGFVVSALARRRPPRLPVFHAPCDVTSQASVDAAVAAAAEANGPPAVLVYSAGAPVFGRTLDVPEDAARHAFEVNFWGLERAVRAVFPRMRDVGGGTVVGIASIAALRAVPWEAHYAASKAAAVRWLECFASEARPHGVTVGWVAPGFLDTGFLERGGWHGMEAPPAVKGSGVSPRDVARRVLRLVREGRTRDVVGWRENAIVLADRVAPGAYDALLARRARR